MKEMGISSLSPNVQAPAPKVPQLEKSANLQQLEKAAKEFEGVFMDLVLKSMRDTVQTSDVFGDDEKPKFFQQMLDTEYAKSLSEKGKGIGLAAAMVRQLSPRIQAENLKAKMDAQKLSGVTHEN